MFINWQIMLSTFTMIFLAEIGDKTQLATFAFATRSKSSLSVFIGASSALVLTTLIAVIMGGIIGRIVPEKIIKIAAGLLFIGFGVATIVDVVKK